MTDLSPVDRAPDGPKTPTGFITTTSLPRRRWWHRLTRPKHWLSFIRHKQKERSSMAIRWRADGRLLCAAMTEPEDSDTYIDDRLSYQLAVVSRAVIPDVDHEANGLWHWVHGDGEFVRGVPEREATRD